MVRDVGLGVGALTNEVSSGVEGLKQGFGGTCTGCRPDLPGLCGGNWCDGASIDVDDCSKEVGVVHGFQLNRGSVEPLLHELWHSRVLEVLFLNHTKSVVHVSLQEQDLMQVEEP